VDGGTTPREIYDRMIELFPDRSYPAALWASACELAR